MSESQQAKVTLLAAKQEIRELVMRYCRGVDRRDMEMVRTAYHNDAVEHHHSAYDGPVSGYLHWLEETVAGFDGMMHHVGNHLAEVEGDRAVAETYALGIHWGGPPEDSRNFTSGVRYIDYLEARGGRWGIVERWAVRDWLRSDANARLPLDSLSGGGSDLYRMARHRLQGQ